MVRRAENCVKLDFAANHRTYVLVRGIYMKRRKICVQTVDCFLKLGVAAHFCGVS